MRRTSVIFGMSMLLLSLTAIAFGDINISVDAKNQQVLVTGNIKDAEIGQVLTTLFNGTNNRYQLQIATGVTGTVAEAKFVQTPFDEALKTLIEKANANFTFTKQGDNFYRISSGQGSGISPTEIKKADNTKAAVNTVKKIKVMLKPVNSSNNATSVDGMMGGTTAESSAAEECTIGMITINNIPVGLLSEALGYGSIPPFEMIATNSNGSSGFSNTNGFNTSSNNSGYNNNSSYNNNSNYNNNSSYNNSSYNTTNSY